MPNEPDGPISGDVAQRFAVDLPAVVKVLATGELAAGRAVNVSATGVFVSSRLAIAVGTPVRVTLSLPVTFGDLQARRLVARAVVRWTNQGWTPGTAHLPRGMGLELVGLSPAERHELQVLVRDRLAAPEWSPVSGRLTVAGAESSASTEPTPSPAGEAPDTPEPQRPEPVQAVAGVGDGTDVERAAPADALVLPAEPLTEPRGDLPRPDRRSGAGDQEPVAPPRSRGGQVRLLLADPDLREMLAREGVFQYRPDRDIVNAKTGEDLVRLAAQVRPVMIILDADRLGASLRQTVAHVRRSTMPRTTPLVATTARMTEMEWRLKGSGVDLVLAKPVDRQQFYGVLRLLGPASGLDVRVAVGTEVPYAADGLDRTGRVANLSRGGLYLAAEPRAPVGTRLTVQLRLPGFAQAIPVTGTVRWVNDGQLAPNLPPGMGLQLVGTSPASLKTVATYVALAKNVVRVT